MLEKDLSQEDVLGSALIKLLGLVIGLVIIITGLIISFIVYVTENKNSLLNENATGVSANAPVSSAQTVNYWNAPDTGSLNQSSSKELVLYGKDIISHTAHYFGPNGIVQKNSSNGLNCQNCHLNAGTQVYGNNYSAVASTYPKFRARSGSIETISKRVNDCFERSLNGKAIDTTSREMKAIIAYFQWLGSNVLKGSAPKGAGLKEIAFLDRAADPMRGKLLYSNTCSSCHKADGQGELNKQTGEYVYPPLWGTHSYNVAAGMYRISNLAKFIRYNMPLGVDHENPVLSEEEAWDIAAYINSMPHPQKDISKDWPDIKAKPFDHPFGPFTDGFGEDQHKFGPYKPIISKNENLK